MLGAIAGTSFLTGDNFFAPAGDISQAKERFREVLCNPEVIRVIKLGKPFLPMLPENYPSSAEVYTLESDGKLYIAVFNFSKKEKTYDVKLPDGNYRVKELWSGRAQTAKGTLQITLPGADSMLFACVKQS